MPPDWFQCVNRPPLSKPSTMRRTYGLSSVIASPFRRSRRAPTPYLAHCAFAAETASAARSAEAAVTAEAAGSLSRGGIHGIYLDFIALAAGADGVGLAGHELRKGDLQAVEALQSRLLKEVIPRRVLHGQLGPCGDKLLEIDGDDVLL